MKKKKLMWFVIVGLALIFIILLLSFFEPLFLRKNYISKQIRFDIPISAQIIDYKYGINTYGVEPFYAKLKLTQDDYEVLKGNFVSEQAFSDIISKINHNYNYESLNIGDVEERWFRDIMTSKASFFLIGSTRVVYAAITKEDLNDFFLYVFY